MAAGLSEPEPRPTGDRSFWGWTVAAAAASIALRVRFWFTPLTPDEAGTSVAAQGWAQGHGLYTDLFIDRPQGLLVLYQRWEGLIGPSEVAVRVLGTVAGVVLVVATALAARTLSRSSTTGAVAAVFVAVFSSSPAIEGHTANAELLASTVGATAVALAAPFIVGRRGAPQLLLAGAAAAAAITVKQSAFDVLLALAGWLTLAAWFRWRGRIELAWAAAALLTGAGVVAAITLAHGASLGWDDYRYALVDFRWEVRSTVAGARWSRLALTSAIALILATPALILSVRHLRAVRRPWRWNVGPAAAFVLLWAATGTAGLLAGGNYHRHYWVQLVPALSVGLALAITAGTPRATARPSPPLVRRLAAAVAVPLLLTATLSVAPGIERSNRIDTDQAVAAWYLEHRAGPEETLLVLCAGANTYAAAGVVPPYPYLWVDHVRSARQARAQLAVLLEGPDRPGFVAVQDPVQQCAPEETGPNLAELGYEPAAAVDDVTIWAAPPHEVP